MKISAYLLVLLCLVLQIIDLQAQICEGNLGENIFTDGDFGQGTDNIVQVDPQIAPGYQYVTTPPPNDGQYTITNNTALWNNIWPGWQPIQDNGPGSTGYMLVVNASFTPGLFYEQEVSGLCENTLYEFSADVFNMIGAGANFILPNVSFLIDGQVFFTTGPVPENEQWNRYGFTFTTAPGQTSVTLSLQNNAPGGIGNDLALDNIRFRPCGPEALILPATIENICEDGDPIDLEVTVVGDQYDDPAFQWQQSFDEGETWVDLPGETNTTYIFDNLAAGFYYYRYLLANGTGNLANSKCRVVSNTKIVRVIPKFYTVNDTICNGTSYQLGNDFFTEAGTYIDSLTTVIGCDSIVTLNLTVVPNGLIEAEFDTTDPSCSDLADGSISLRRISNGAPPYSILINDEPNFTLGNILDQFGGDYSYQIIDRYGCSLSTVVSLINPPVFEINLGSDISVELGEEVQISASFSDPVLDFSWSPAEIVDCNTDCERFTLLPLNSTTLSLVATSINNCVAADSILINVIDVRKVYIPNVFSPNLDGINDVFTIYGDVPNVQQIEKLAVFDRWGALIFEQVEFPPNSTSLGWDGSFKSRDLPVGVYTYYAEIRFLDNQIRIYSGDISILR